MWKDKVRNEATRETTGQDMMETTIKKRRLRWFSYMRCMDDSRRTKWAWREEKRIGVNHILLGRIASAEILNLGTPRGKTSVLSGS